jgi:di/tricarboxylate transporter
MTPETQILSIFLVLVIALVLFVTEKLPADLVALLVVATLGISGILTPEETFSGFSRSAVVTIIAIFIIADALQRTGVTEKVGTALIRYGGNSEKTLLASVMAAGAFLSLFMNNVAATAVLLPAVSGASKKSGVSLSKLLMPLAFATSLGGMATLLTTSNIVLNSLLIENDIPSFRITDFAPLGIPITLVGIVFFVLIGRRLLPGQSAIDRTTTPSSSSEMRDLVHTYHLGENLFRIRVPKGSVLCGKTLSESGLRQNYLVSVLAIERKNKKNLSISAETRLEEGDILVLEGNEDKFRELDTEPLMEFLPPAEWSERYLESNTIEVVEVMLSPRSRLIDQTVRDVQFRDRYGMSVLAIWRADKEIVTGLADERLAFGDALLIQGPREKLRLLASDPDVIPMMQTVSTQVHGKGIAASTIFVLTLALAIIFPSITGSLMLGGAIAMILAGILSTEQAYSSISWKTVFIIAGMLPLGIALSKPIGSGPSPASLVSGYVMEFLAGMNLGWALTPVIVGSLCLLTVILVQLINSGVVAAIIGPIALIIAQSAGIDQRATIMAVAVASSMAFSSPLGHPVNIMVMGPGGYNFRDYVKVGIPLTIIVFVALMILLPIVWKF